MADGSELLKFAKIHLCDPPQWFIPELDFRTLKALAVNEVEMHKAILDAQSAAAERTLAILESAQAAGG